MGRRKSKTSILLAVMALTTSTAVAVWQFYQFTTFKTASGVIDPQGGTRYLWWAIGLGLMAFVGALFYASFFLRYNKNYELHIISPPSPRELIL